MKKRLSFILLPLIALIYVAPLLLSHWALSISSVAYAAQPDIGDVGGEGGGWDDECKDGIKLNTDVPFIGKCIKKDDADNAFPALIGGLSKMVVTAILIVSFLMIIVGGVMRTTGGKNVWKGKEMIIKVAIWLAILGASGAILQLINPNFFK